MNVSERISKRGFTLIELLIVIAIIGILASALLVSLGGARQAARDARRIADMRTIQTALEVYFNSTGCYPGDVVGVAACSTGVDPAGWTGLGTSLNTKIPNDPVRDSTYFYGVDVTNQSYAIGATLENDKNQVFLDDLDGPAVPSGSASTINCDDPVYCVSL